MQKANRIWASLLALIILVLIGIALLQPHTDIPASTGTSSTTTAATTTATETHNGVTGTGSFTVSNDNTVNLKIPDFQSAIHFSPDIQAEVKDALQNAANTLETRLASNSLDLKSWVDLGTVRKMAGDYSGAEKAWTFVTQAAPTNSIAYNNLGDLYENFIKNYPRAEQAYLNAIKYSPSDESPYINLAVMYQNTYKQGTTAAEDILKKGVAAIPSSVALHVDLARYYKGKGDAADAKIQFDAAIAAAKASGQNSVAEELQAEENQ